MSRDHTVYSSQSGRNCPACGQPIKRCRCPRRPAARELPTGDRVRVGRSSKGRKGKPVTTIEGLPLGDAALRDLARDLKRLCGSGGSLREGTIEIQGEHRDQLIEALRERGFDAKKSGG
ncbi:MAG: stress response translation initiation inhibitor YciH [Myxococcota bacterium]|jgi:translation initiation factor 1